jgi:hypothetical protein
MGDYSVSCALSGITLTYDQAALIALAPAHFCDGERKRPTFEHGAVVVSNEGAGAYFTPLLLPIFGTLDGCGRLRDIAETEHTKFLEARLDLSIHDIADGVRGGQSIPRITKAARIIAQNELTPYKKQTTWDGRLYGCYVSRAIWDEFSTGTWSEGGDPDYLIWDEGWIDVEVLQGMGFVKHEQDVARASKHIGKGPHGGDRYNTPWTHPECPQLTVWCDQHMSSRFSVGRKKLEPHGIYHPKQLQAALEARGLSLPASSIAWAKATPSIYTKLLAARRRRASDIRMDRDYRKHFAEDPSRGFSLISDSTPADILEGLKEAMRANLSRMLDAALEPSKDNEIVPPFPHLQVHPGAVQVFCDGKKHVSLTAAEAGAIQSIDVTGCSKGEKCGALIHIPESPELKFTPEVYAALKEAGWKPKPVRRLYHASMDPYFRAVAPELIELYRSKGLRAFRTDFEALYTFMHNMSAANRLWQPTNTGWQYGNFPTQLRVALAATRLITKRLDERAKDD